jgi:Ca2+-binding EF-hand superfamily protein
MNQAKTEYKIYIQEFFNSLTKLTDGNIFRHELTQLNLDIPEELKKEFVNYLTRTLYPKIYST